MCKFFYFAFWNVAKIQILVIPLADDCLCGYITYLKKTKKPNLVSKAKK
jgi:hypothetical protein